MKTYLIKSILLILIACPWSCSDLEEEPEGLLAPEGFFVTPDDVQAAVYGAYAEWVTTQMEKSFFLSLMLRGDMVGIGDANTLADRITTDNFTMDANNSIVEDGWKILYTSISAANTAISAARSVEAEDQVKKELEGEARFIRAYSYYHLVRSFGAVPYIDSPIENVSELDNAIRVPTDEVYDHIIDDLLFAKENLPNQNELKVRNIGTKGSASTVLAEVYLTLERFEEAASEARFIISNRETFDYDLEQNYQDLFNADLAGTLKESILTIDLKNNLNDGSYNPMDGMINLTRIRDYAPRSLSVAVPSLKVYTTWDYRDYRRKVSFEDSVLIDGKKTALVDTDFRVPRPHIAKYFRFPGPQDSGDDRSSDHHYNLYRYADVLLIAAEAIAETEGATPEAIGYVNQIRSRARFNGQTTTNFPEDIPLGIGREEFIQLVREERRLEFAFEFKRWYDIKRWGILEEAFTGEQSLENHAVDATRDYLYPIPQVDINISNLTQNPGY